MPNRKLLGSSAANPIVEAINRRSTHLRSPTFRNVFVKRKRSGNNFTIKELAQQMVPVIKQSYRKNIFVTNCILKSFNLQQICQRMESNQKLC